MNEGVREKENSDRLEWIQAHVQCEGLSEVPLTHTTLYLTLVFLPPSLHTLVVDVKEICLFSVATGL